MGEVKIYATVECRVRVHVPTQWNETCVMKQVFEQAREAALRALRSGLVLDNVTTGTDQKTQGRLLDTKVTSIIAEET